jgi:hypothetical protein
VKSTFAIALLLIFVSAIRAQTNSLAPAAKWDPTNSVPTTNEIVFGTQRTANEIRSSYNETLCDRAKAPIELQRAAGLWGIQF